jgi:hypothetical protein
MVVLDRAGVRARKSSLTLAHELGHVFLDDVGCFSPGTYFVPFGLFYFVAFVVAVSVVGSDSKVGYFFTSVEGFDFWFVSYVTD